MRWGYRRISAFIHSGSPYRLSKTADLYKERLCIDSAFLLSRRWRVDMIKHKVSEAFRKTSDSPDLLNLIAADINELMGGKGARRNWQNICRQRSVDE